MKKRKKILITGGAGFIGSALARVLVSKGYSVRIIDNLCRGDKSIISDLIDQGDVEFVEGDIRYLPKLLDVCDGVDMINHQAADCINKSLQNPIESFEINILGTTNVFEAARIKNIVKVVFASSASVFGEPKSLPMNEDTPLNPITPYCISKATIENIATYYFTYFGINHVGLRYFNVYGPRQNTDAYYTSVIILFLKKIMKNEPPIIDGDGKQSMDFIHLNDVVNANVMALEKEIKAEVFNIGTNRSTSIAELVNILIDSCGKKSIKPRFTGKKSIVSRRKTDYSKAQSLLGWDPQVNVVDGLNELAQDIIDHPDYY